MRRIQLDQLQEAEEIYPRSHVDWHTVTAYGEALRARTVFPPVIAAPIEGREGLWLLDGWHRLAALRSLGRKTVPCEVLDELTEPEALLEAARRNATHGRPMGFTEKLEVYRRLRAQGYKAERVAPSLSMTKTSLEYWAERRIRVAATGEEVVLRPPVEHLVEVEDPEGQEVLLGDANPARIIRNLIILIERKWLPEDEHVQEALDELRGLLCG